MFSLSLVLEYDIDMALSTVSLQRDMFTVKVIHAN